MDSIWTLAFLVFNALGWLSALHVLGSGRTAEATIAWVLGLIFLSPLVVPYYWVFGARRYEGYTSALREAMTQHHRSTEAMFDRLAERSVTEDRPAVEALRRLTPFPLTEGNETRLLVTGEETFDAIFEAIGKARKYILIELFTIEVDTLGRRFLDALAARAREGVQVCVLYDILGSMTLHHRDIAQWKKAGVCIQAFRNAGRRPSRLRLNFRNHRKICVMDGEVAFIGGNNVGDLYLRPQGRIKMWRDTHLELRGPAVTMLQAVFVADWYWSTAEVMADLRWETTVNRTASGEVMIIATGPADHRPHCVLMWLEMCRLARNRLWIATPYLVPSDAVAMALEAAARRGVDVRILTTSVRDHFLTFMAGWYFAEQIRKSGVRVYRYKDAFMHQKVILVDDTLAAVSTVNLDMRSLLLNFEVTALLTDETSIRAIDTMLAADFENSVEDVWEWNHLGLFRRTAARVCRLFAPLL